MRTAVGKTRVDTEVDMPQSGPSSAICVKNSNGSRCSAFHNAYHTSLRPSSLLEPRHPSLKVVISSVAQQCCHEGGKHVRDCKEQTLHLNMCVAIAEPKSSGNGSQTFVHKQLVIACE